VKVLGKAGNSKKFSFGADLLARFDFSGSFDQNSYPSVSNSQQSKFQTDFAEQFKKVQAALSDYKWLSPDAPLPPRVTSGPYQPPTDFHVFVSDAYDLSRALVPGWLGHRGWMEFPAHRVTVGGAAITHELVHVLFPNGNRMLAEGLAVYLQYKLLPRIPVLPNYGQPLEEVVGNFLSENFQGSPSDALWNMDLDGFENIATPDELYMRIGTRPYIGGDPSNSTSSPDPHQVKFVYAVAGSLVEFLLENPIEENDLLTVENFGALYQSTPLRPLERDSGSSDRWQKYYRAKDGKGNNKSYSFRDLGLLWKTYMHFILFTGEKDMPIPDEYRKIRLVTELCSKLKSMAGQSATKQSARRPRQRTK
jgi:hypothetical protein